ncbi:hypothetical protein MPNT_50015 [Candidatus Methylacidithermus pantelleriae]|uniref:Uncharacterized protein n=1 Tax=Candidatus Methylacidithermus pantelleriae TaxID=2744239 RepID=A0A8J2BKA3_9BACT|nr:hypothetical protein MPNT_50015 [Candidatus Methylacidithermus pantelleriae]
MRWFRAPSWHGSARISSRKAWHTMKRSPPAGRARYRRSSHSARHQDRSTLAGQSRLPVLETDTDQLEAVLDQDSADLRMTNLPNELFAIAVHPRADHLTALTIRSRLLESKLREPKPACCLNPLFSPALAHPRVEGHPIGLRRVRMNNELPSWQRFSGNGQTPPFTSAKPSCTQHPAAWPTYSHSEKYCHEQP